MARTASSEPRHRLHVPKTAELVAGRIRHQIVTHELHEGEALPTESALMEDFGISRPTLREAFRILESEGLITVRRGARGGARVQEPSVAAVATAAGLVLQHRTTTISDVLEARVLIETPAARLLAERRSRGAIAKRLRAEHELVTEDPATFDRFNQVLVELTGNQTLILVASILEGISHAAAVRRTSGQRGDDRLARRGARARLKLIELIADGDADGAERLWRVYLEEAAEALARGTGRTLVDLYDSSRP